MINLDDVVKAYIECGQSSGFLIAETILMRHLPKNKLEGKCHDVAVKKRKPFLAALQAATQEVIQQDECKSIDLH